MPSQTLSPDAILAQTSLTGTVSAIQDDPDTPDGAWLVASDNNSSTDVRVSFATPNTTPTVGAGLQEFRVRVRRFSASQSGVPTARVELWENGSLIRAGSEVNVTGTGQVISFTWNASELTTGSGANVECMVVGTKTGGSPTTRNTVDVGAVEWNATVDEAATPVTADRTLRTDWAAKIPASDHALRAEWGAAVSQQATLLTDWATQLTPIDFPLTPEWIAAAPNSDHALPVEWQVEPATFNYPLRVEWTALPPDPVDVSQVRAYAAMGPAANSQHLSQLRVYGVLGPQAVEVKVSQLRVYAVVRPLVAVDSDHALPLGWGVRVEADHSLPLAWASAPTVDATLLLEHTALLTSDQALRAEWSATLPSVNYTLPAEWVQGIPPTDHALLAEWSAVLGVIDSTIPADWIAAIGSVDQAAPVEWSVQTGAIDHTLLTAWSAQASYPLEVALEWTGAIPATDKALRVEWEALNANLVVDFAFLVENTLLAADPIEVSQLRTYGVLGPVGSEQHVSQVRAYAVMGPPLVEVKVSQLRVYAVLGPQQIIEADFSFPVSWIVDEVRVTKVDAETLYEVDPGSVTSEARVTKVDAETAYANAGQSGRITTVTPEALFRVDAIEARATALVVEVLRSIENRQIGSGTVDDPYIITTAQHLFDVRNNLAAYYLVAADIDLLAEYPDWVPIGATGTPFTGDFEGAGHHITGLQSTFATDHSGLFGVIGGGANIRHIGVTTSGTGITGPSTYYQGVLVGSGAADASWSIADCYAEGTITHGGDRAGGLIGEADNASTGSGASLSRCWAAVTMVGTTGTLVGAFAGYSDGSQVTDADNHADTDVSVSVVVGSAGTNTDIAAANTTAQMRAEATFTNWDFANIWTIDEGNDYPRFAYQIAAAQQPIVTVMT